MEMMLFIGARPSKQPLMVRTLLKGYIELGSYLFLQKQMKDIIIILGLLVVVRARARLIIRALQFFFRRRCN
jgi:hypothetical protein